MSLHIKCSNYSNDRASNDNRVSIRSSTDIENEYTAMFIKYETNESDSDLDQTHDDMLFNTRNRGCNISDELERNPPNIKQINQAASTDEATEHSNYDNYFTDEKVNNTLSTCITINNISNQGYNSSHGLKMRLLSIEHIKKEPGTHEMTSIHNDTFDAQEKCEINDSDDYTPVTCTMLSNNRGFNTSDGLSEQNLLSSEQIKQEPLTDDLAINYNDTFDGNENNCEKSTCAMLGKNEGCKVSEVKGLYRGSPDTSIEHIKQEPLTDDSIVGDTFHVNENNCEKSTCAIFGNNERCKISEAKGLDRGSPVTSTENIKQEPDEAIAHNNVTFDGEESVKFIYDNYIGQCNQRTICTVMNKTKRNSCNLNASSAVKTTYITDEKSYKTFIDGYIKRQMDDYKQSKTEQTIKKYNHTSTCEKCEFVTQWSCKWKEHLKIKHTEPKQYACEKCEFVTQWPCKLKEHHKIKHTAPKQYKCDSCHFTTLWPSNLTLHKQQHSDEKPYKCDLCDYSAIWPCLMKRHRLKHTGEKPYMCEVCGYSTMYPSSLSSHRRIHTGERPYKCDTCDYTARLSGHLKQHKLKHTREKLKL